MVEGPEADDRIDLYEDNYMEDVEETEEQSGDDGERGAKHDVDDNSEERDSESETSGDDQSPQMERSHASVEPAVDEEERHSPLIDDDKDKHAELLSLPPHGSEVFIGGLPRDILEEDLRCLCEPNGEIFEIRLIKDKGTGESKGYAFVAFTAQEDAQKAIEELHDKEYKGKTLRCTLSESKNRLFIGNVPKSMKDDEFRNAIEGVGPGVETIELIKVKALYVKNIPENTTIEQLKELFQRHGEVVKVVMPPSKSGSNKRDFGFVHYAERASALKAVKDAEKYEIDGHALEVVLAKPQSEKKSDTFNIGIHASQLAGAGYGGVISNPFGAPHSGYGISSSFQQPMIYGRGPMPSGMHMVPMVLPDGRIGYVLQQPGAQIPHPRSRRTDSRNGQGGRGGGAGGSSIEEGNRSRRYRPY
ncbi:hypothetical protein SAY86_011942 [Trapa natans]|uniref:RRM domain-containing protein n=1 Tax=Trapa natans TaxID=22666 RepID=A0AAN7LRD8_TRANT|nr:hypothetical protein SAY86_011942 [Trapa natans]